MNKYNLISLLALLALVAVLPWYALREQARLETAAAALEASYLAGGVSIYLENCAECHGVNGEGLGSNPSLRQLALAQADPELLFRTIARASHDSKMASWHREEGGVLDDYQIQQLVTLLRAADWTLVEQMAAADGITPREPDTLALSEVYQAALKAEDPHQCVACHEDPEVHAGRFGLDCVRCHTLAVWTPALLTRHTFRLDHGGEGEVACETCHLEAYTEHSCYGCHDHSAEQMPAAHEPAGIYEYERCIDCHPTGEAGEAEQLQQESYESQEGL